MTSAVLNYIGMKFDERAAMNKPHFHSDKTGKDWALDPGGIDFNLFPVGKLYVEWDNWIATKATTDIPKGGGKFGGKGYQPPPYHPQTFVSNVVGQAISAGVIDSPDKIAEWAKAATSTIIAVNRKLDGEKAAPAPAAPDTPAYDKDVPF